MKWRTFIIAVVAAVAIPVAFAAPPGPSPSANPGSPSQRCSAQLKAIGGVSFNQLYAGSATATDAFGKCVSKLTRQDNRNVLNAEDACRAEQANTAFATTHSGKTFAQFYGTGKNGSTSAFGRCVSGKANAAALAQQQATISAARTCRSLQLTNATTFKSTYGATSKAFGKCVAAHTKA
jgi:hypothetical protein